MGRTALAIVAAALAGCAGEEILHGLEEPQANEVLVALHEMGISASKLRDDREEGRWRVDVARTDAASAHRILAERELPRVRPPGIGEVFGGGSMVPTPTEEHVRYLHALAGELARTVEAIDGVSEARVHVGLPQPDPLRPGLRMPPRGAVLVKCRPSQCVAVRALEPAIRAVVAGAADGLEPEAVSVLIAEAAESPTRPGAAPPRRSALLAGLAAGAALSALVFGVLGIRARLRREMTS